MPKGWESGANSGLDTAILTYTKVLLTEHLSECKWMLPSLLLPSYSLLLLGHSLLSILVNATQKSLEQSAFDPAMEKKF